nr:PREDICTED: uncharacterized protein LOC105673016 [Linepithema humile]
MRFVIVVCILSFYVIIPQLRNMIRAWGNIMDMVECLVSVNFSLMALCNLVAIWYHGKAVFYVWFHSLKLRRSMHQPQRILAYQFGYPYNTQKSPNYEITFFLQLSGGVYSGLINCIVNSFITMLLLHVCAQLKNLRTTLNNKVDELAKNSISTLRFKEGLAAIVIRHEHLMKNAKTVIDCYRGVLFLQMLATTFLLCFKSFEVYTSTSMADGVYECKWYDLLSENAGPNAHRISI